MRTLTKVNEELLGRIIVEVDDAKLGNWNSVFTAIATNYNTRKAADLKELSAAIVKARINLWNVNLQTPKGKRGRKAGTKGGGRISNAQKAINEHCLKCKKNAEKIGACSNVKCHWNSLRPFQPKVVKVVAPAVEPVQTETVAEPVVEAAVVQPAAEMATV
jgi:hypothetical protein